MHDVQTTTTMAAATKKKAKSAKTKIILPPHFTKWNGWNLILTDLLMTVEVDDIASGARRNGLFLTLANSTRHCAWQYWLTCLSDTGRPIDRPSAVGHVIAIEFCANTASCSLARLNDCCNIDTWIVVAKFTLRPSLAFSYIGSVTARHSSSGPQPNFAMWYKELNYGTFTEGATYIRLGGHHVGHQSTF